MLAFGKKQDLGPSEEVQGALRLLGVTEDADYDEVTSQYRDLCDKYKGETKRLIKLQVAKDRVLEYRLAQRMAGTYTGATVSASNLDIGDNRKEEKKPLIKVPQWAENLVSLPTPFELTRNIACFTFFSALPLLNRKWVATSGAFGLGSSFFMLYNRGMPQVSGEEMAEMQTREVKRGPVLRAVGLVLFNGIVGGLLTSFLPVSLFLGSMEVAIAAGLNVGFFCAATFFKVKDKDDIGWA